MAQSPKLNYDYKSNLKEIEKAIKLRLCDPDKNPLFEEVGGERREMKWLNFASIL